MDQFITTNHARYCACLTIHYHRDDGRYDGWYLWLWLEGQGGALFEFTGHDDYGVFSRVDCQKLSNSTRIGLLIKKSRDRWDQGKEEARFIDMPGPVSTEVWLLENDPGVYCLPPEIKIRVIAAFADEPGTITVNLSSPIVSDKEGELRAVSFCVYEEGGKIVPVHSIRNKNLLGQKTSFTPRQAGYEILENGAVHFIYDPSLEEPGERLEGPRSVYVLGSHNKWQQGDGDPRWKMWWNEQEKYYELIAYLFPHDGSVQFKFKEALDNPDYGWVPDSPIVLLGLQTRKLLIELEKELDLRHEYYLDTNTRVIPRKILAGPRYFYDGNDLGATWSPQATTFKVFAPMATALSVIVYPDLRSEQGREIAMSGESNGRWIAQSNGIWSTTVPGDLEGSYYTFRITCYGQQAEVIDPYCRCVCAKIRGVLTDYVSGPSPSGGICCTQESVLFRFPFGQAQKLRVMLYRSFDDSRGIEVPLTRDEDGLWQGSQSGDWQDAFYMLRLNDQEIVDPWAKIIAVGPSRGKIVNFQKINQQVDWQEDDQFRQSRQFIAQEAVIYELHLRDFTMATNSGIKNRGLYTGLTERESRGPEQVKTGLDHLLELGVSHVQIMPTQNFTSWIGPEKFHRLPHYNWGYMPTLFFSPEATMSSDPTGETMIVEFKQMIKALHQAGLRVVMDVVYNHYDNNRAPFDKLAPYYYFRMNEKGEISNGSGCGNEFNSTYPMARKLLLDSLKFWVEEYHVDGFRFDLMGLIDIETMTMVAEELHAIYPAILLYGEPWAAGDSALEELNDKGRQKGRGYSVFNDNFRDAIKGSPNGTDPAFVQGHSSTDTARLIRRGLKGSIEDFAQEPAETVNYVTCHDDLVLRDKLEISTELDEKTRKKMVKLSALLILLAQGIPFLHSGLEIFRTKQHIANSYNQPDSINQIDWQLKVDHADIFHYLQGVIALRKQHPAFRLNRAEEIQRRVQVYSPLPDQIVYSIDGAGLNGEIWPNILVLINGHTSKSANFLLPDGEWREIRLDSGAGQEGEKFSTSVTLSPSSGIIFYGGYSNFNVS